MPNQLATAARPCCVSLREIVQGRQSNQFLQLRLRNEQSGPAVYVSGLSLWWHLFVSLD